MSTRKKILPAVTVLMSCALVFASLFAAAVPSARAVPVSIFLKAPESSALPTTPSASPLIGFPESAKQENDSGDEGMRRFDWQMRLNKSRFVIEVFAYWQRLKEHPLGSAVIGVAARQLISKILLAPAQSFIPQE